MSSQKTKIVQSTTSNPKIKQADRLCDTANIKLRDILLKDLISESDMKTYYSEDKANILRQMNIFIDKYEDDPMVSFNFSVNGEPASKVCNKYELITLSGKNNESGSDPVKSWGTVLQSAPDTVVQFKMPIDDDNTFSYHKDGIRYANYVIYGIPNKVGSEENTSRDAKQSKIMLSKGRIYLTDVLFDLTENILDGQ
ncbi:MAG: hypothetical protein KAH01_07675 [Caldisericia bacterium]|nr:hypothetical protein [Caldisericia bacterium]